MIMSRLEIRFFLTGTSHIHLGVKKRAVMRDRNTGFSHMEMMIRGYSRLRSNVFILLLLGHFTLQGTRG